ncbi:MAG: hypothetical protein H7318_09695 [Oligoflexus sp.]|nr:hypothetical protein [Oligoflexus sp.]
MPAFELYVALVVTTLVSLTSVIYMLRHRHDFAEKVILQSRIKILESRLHTLMELKPLQAEEMIKIECIAEEKSFLLDVAKKDLVNVREELFEAEFKLQVAQDKIIDYEKVEIALNSANIQINQLNYDLFTFRSAANTMALMMQKAVKHDIFNKGFMIEDVKLFTEVRDNILPKICDVSEQKDQAA